MARTPLAVAVVAALTVGLAAPPALGVVVRADEGGGGVPAGTAAPADLGPLPVPAQDVTGTDTDLGSTDREVVALVRDGDGSPNVTKLRARTGAEAVRLAEALDARPGVVASANSPVQAFDALGDEPRGSDQWNLPRIGAPTVWARSTGAGVVVAVVDTGVDATHPDLTGRVRPAVDLLGEDLGDGDPNGHGTAVASIVAAGLNEVGMAGVAPGATILPVVALDPLGEGDTSTVAQAIIAAADAGARVVNLSLGGPDRDPVLDAACEYAWSKGAVLVGAAGNTFAAGNEVQYPAAGPHVLGVGSVDRDGDASYFSNSGSYLDVAAPGEQLTAAEPGAAYSSDYAGTSFAAPQVSGALAVLLGAYPKLTKGTLVNLIKYTAQDDASLDGLDDDLGYGVLRVDRALAAATAMAAANLPAATRVRVARPNASPEPVRKGKMITVRGTVQARYPDGTWRADPVPLFVQVQYRRSGTTTWRTVGTAASRVGSITLKEKATYSGYWRTRVKQHDGSWTVSKVDYVKVVR